ncbi:HAMP domain-containing sensor histidine kinase [Roseiarcaceae bacterium H3SJ34-1]|uniref:sensor histidine kinase n=1 Tax=Terripilifer ovatus TaxID=3032367 RepID=UPI003AB9904A|nr:HAMP domain-containing sensor histidine kinase [Roseiarcaceae bacterium H3SJ34-1]
MTDIPRPRLSERRKWRPSLGLVVFVVLATVLALPLFSLYFLRIYENQLIRQTEGELIAQSAALAATLHREIETSIPESVPLGVKVSPRVDASASQAVINDEPYRPIWPELDLSDGTILPPRPAARPPASLADPAFVALGARMMPDLVRTQNLTLAGFRLLDPHGNVLGGREEVGLSLAHIEEVADALQGRFRSVLRARISGHRQPPLESISRGTSLRVFTAVPVIVRDQVAAVVYASRTPSSVFKHLYEQRRKFVLAALWMILPTLLIGYVFHRTITAPMRELVERTRAVGSGDRNALQPLKRHGTKEFASLSQSFLDMAGRLNQRSDFISTFATHVSHELKSPLTSIQGAAELLRDDIDATAPMSDSDRRKFIDNIVADADRLTKISIRLREFARADSPLIAGVSKLASQIAGLRAAFPPLEIQASGDIDVAVHMSEENLMIVLSNLADNAMRHGAMMIDLAAVRQEPMLIVTARDNGEGVSPNNRSRIFDSFFTTRRDTGGTGMGLAIVRAMLEAHGGAIRLLDSDQGAAFEISIPLAPDGASS